MTTKAAQRDAVAARDQALDDIKRAKLAGGTATAAKQQASADLRAAERDRQEAAEAKALGEADADERFDDAERRWIEAHQRLDRAQLEDEAALRVVRSAQARLAQIKQTHYRERVEHIEAGLMAELEQAAENLADPLRAYLALYQQAAAALRALGPAFQAAILDDDQARGRVRDMGQVYDEAAVPDCPLPQNVVELIRKMPKPRFLTAGHTPTDDPGAPIGAVTVTDA